MLLQLESNIDLDENEDEKCIISSIFNGWAKRDENVIVFAIMIMWFMGY
jgi:hypothetical protein